MGASRCKPRLPTIRPPSRAVARRRACTTRRSRTRIAKIDAALGRRASAYPQRAARQSALLNLPAYPTTTIGSFPQTAEIRQARSQFKSGRLDEAGYKTVMQHEIARSVQEQEALGLDVLVHGEAERNDMVEYFGEQLDGYAFSEFGWVQTYGSRCVKPPILFGDISRPEGDDGASGSRYAQSQTAKPMKGMLTGPVTILKWSFVRDDQPRRPPASNRAGDPRGSAGSGEGRRARSSRSTKRRCVKACRCASRSGNDYLRLGGRMRSASPPTACRTRRRSTRTCATRSSTTSSLRSPRWMLTSSRSRRRVGHGIARRVRPLQLSRTKSGRASTTSTRRISLRQEHIVNLMQQGG